ncbi:MAG: DNA cytosine methyltransferase [Eubacteriales bacterium]|nr:DNA cytosine methyltransferase [Eubacteriales bacterium]
MVKLTHIDLFSGIGGFALSARWAGIKTVQFVEIDPFCHKVLNKNFPGVPIHNDIKTFQYSGASPFILTGGFPCQDISLAGKGAGLSGERSGLWSEYERIISELRPRYIIVENSTGLLVRGFDRVLCDLSKNGYDAEWQVIRASDAGAPHKRERLYVVAYPHGINGEKGMGIVENGKGKIFPLDLRERFPIWLQTSDQFIGMADGIPTRLYEDRGRSIGNAIVPQIAFQIMKAILEVENEATMP